MTDGFTSSFGTHEAFKKRSNMKVPHSNNLTNLEEYVEIKKEYRSLRKRLKIEKEFIEA